MGRVHGKTDKMYRHAAELARDGKRVIVLTPRPRLERGLFLEHLNMDDQALIIDQCVSLKGKGLVRFIDPDTMTELLCLGDNVLLSAGGGE